MVNNSPVSSGAASLVVDAVDVAAVVDCVLVVSELLAPLDVLVGVAAQPPIKAATKTAETAEHATDLPLRPVVPNIIPPIYE
jgi:hypothetical protein